MQSDKTVRIGIDIGGTFTDLVVSDGEKIYTEKTDSTPANPAQGAFDVLDKAGIDPQDIQVFDHATTVATNTIIERNPGANVVFLTNDGFADIPEIMRTERENQYDRQWEKPEPLVPREHRHGVPGRITASGDEDTSLDLGAAREIIEDYADSDGQTTYAISMLYSFLDSSHEASLEELINELDPESFSSASYDIFPQAKEYERASTVIANAFLKPKMEAYIGNLEANLAKTGNDTSLNIMQSNGGLLPVHEVLNAPAKCAFSGPAAGVIGGGFFGSAHSENVITLDMGGTSTDVGIIREGEPDFTTEGEVEWGIPIQFPQVDIEAVGAGGGSIAWIDRGGALKVGPQSAGADPGPVCYGRGGTQPTITDANLVLGRINPDNFIGGDMKLDTEAAEDSIRSLGEQLGLSLQETALGILEISLNKLTQAIRVVSVERGYDPRDFNLVAFGGAGPMHAPRVSQIANIPDVIVPPNPGVLSAAGLLTSDFKHDQVYSFIKEINQFGPEEIDDLNDSIQEIKEESLARVDQQSAYIDDINTEILADLRYVEQAYEITVHLADETPITMADLREAKETFHDEHQRQFGHSHEDDPVEFVNVRVNISGNRTEPRAFTEADETKDIDGITDAIKTTRDVVYSEGVKETRIIDRARLGPGHEIAGPAIIEEDQSTTLVFPDQTARIDRNHNIVITTEETNE